MSSNSRSRSSTPSLRDPLQQPQSDASAIESTTRRISSSSSRSSDATSSSPIAIRKTTPNASMSYTSQHTISSRIKSFATSASSPSSPAKGGSGAVAAGSTSTSPAASTFSASVPPSPFNYKLFKKCKSATFQIDGATYTIGTSSAVGKIIVVVGYIVGYDCILKWSLILVRFVV